MLEWKKGFLILPAECFLLYYFRGQHKTSKTEMSKNKMSKNEMSKMLLPKRGMNFNPKAKPGDERVD